MSHALSPLSEEERRLARWLISNSLAPHEEPEEECELPVVPLSEEDVRRILAKALGLQPVGDPPRFLPPIIESPVRRAFNYSRLAIAIVALSFLLATIAVVRRLAIFGRDAASGAVERLIDDSDVGFRTTGDGWRPGKIDGFRGSHHYNAQGARSAFWTFEGLPGGTYEVFAAWAHHENRPREVPLIVRDGDQIRDSIILDQSIRPRDLKVHGAVWKRLGTYRITKGRLTVEMDSTLSKTRRGLAFANSCSADAILVRSVNPTAPPPRQE